MTCIVMYYYLTIFIGYLSIYCRHNQLQSTITVWYQLGFIVDENWYNIIKNIVRI